MTKPEIKRNVEYHSAERVMLPKWITASFASKLLSFKAAIVFVLAVFCVGGTADANPTMANRISVDGIIGEAQVNANQPGYYEDFNSGRVGGTGSNTNSTRFSSVPVVGFELPTLPVGQTVDSVTLHYQITGYRYEENPNFTADVYLLDSSNPGITGTSFYHMGASDPNVDAKFIGSTDLPNGASGTNITSNPAIAVAHVLSGDALSTFKSYYLGENSPTQSEVFLRFNRSSADNPPLTNNQVYERYIIDTDVANLYLEITSAAPETTPPTLAGSDIVDDAGGGPVGSGTVVNYTVTFSEDIDESTVDVADFGNAGSVSVSIGTITETSPGVFTLPVTPTGDGTLRLQVNASAVITDVVGNALDTTAAIPDDTAITVTTGNLPPAWTTDTINGVGATANSAYSGTLTGAASDPNDDPLTFAKVNGNAWLVVGSGGGLSGIPGAADVGLNRFTVSVSDNTAVAVEATLIIEVLPDGSWRSTLYPSGWSPPDETALFYDDKIIQDFSFAGYKRGEEPVPTIMGPVFDVTDAAYGADPTGAIDSTLAIQNAIDAAALAGGGVVYLPAGNYKISPQGGNGYCLMISSPDIVLRGAGAGSTFLTNTATDMRSKDVIRVRSGSVTTEASVNITADLNGPTRRLPVAAPGSFAVGDVVRLEWSFTDEWIAEHNQQSYWSEAGGNPGDVRYLREVTAVDEAGGWIEVDVPTRYTMKVRDSARVSVVNGLLENVGVESLAIGNVQHPGAGFGENDYNVSGTAAYDAHASYILEMQNVRDGWITGVESFQPVGNTSTCHMLSNGILVVNSCRITVSDCRMSRPQYGGGGGNGYMYRLQYSNECLVQNSVADFSRHGIVLSHAGTSGNVFHQCDDRETKRATGSTGSYTTNGSGSDHHMHFSHSNLFDRCSVFNSFYTASHRGNSGTTPHGLSSAHGVYWNTSGSGTRYNDIVLSSQGRYGYVIGTSGSKFGASNPTSGNTAPADHLEGIGSGDSLYPASLYLDQLSRRVTPTVSYAGNGSDGGTVPVDANSPYSPGETVTVFGQGSMTRSGFSFAGWNTESDGSGMTYAPGDSFKIENHVTLHALWTGLGYTVTFDANGGDAPIPASKTVTNGETYGSLASATRSGYNLLGWFSQATGGIEVTSETIVETLSDLILYARWSQPPVVDAGADLAASLSGSLDWTPAELTTSAWFDAADPSTISQSSGAVSQWNDKSGNENHATQIASADRPQTGTQTINGVNALVSQASVGEHMDLTSTIVLSDHSVFGVLQAASDPVDLLTSMGVLAETQNSWDGYAMTFREKSGGFHQVRSEDNGGIIRESILTGATTLTMPFLFGEVKVKGTSNQRYYNGNDTGDAGAQPNDLSIGVLFRGYAGDIGNNGQPWDGKVGEILIINSALSDGDRQKVEGYLAHKWGLEDGLPAGHPFKASAPTMTGVTMNLDGTVGDPEDDALTTAWSVVGGPAAVEFGDVSAVDTTARFSANGTYTLRLTADDGAGTTTDDLVVRIGDLPTVTVWPTAADIVEGQSLAEATLNGGVASVAGSFHYDNPATTPGTGTYSAAVTFTPDDPMNYLPVSGSVDVTILTAFEGWVSNGGGDGITFDGDANRDGIADGLAWLLGAATPSQAATDLMPSASASDGDLVLGFTLMRSSRRGSAVLQLQYSNDLGVGDPWTFNTVTVPEVSTTIDGVEFIVSPVDGTNLNQVEARVPTSAAGAVNRLFARLVGALSTP